MNSEGILIVVSGPSGAGKSTVISKAMEKNKNMCFSISATTRSPRPGEQNGREYYFVTGQRFSEMVENDELLEHAAYAGNYYGTPRKPIEDMLSRGCDVVLDIEVQGAEQVKGRMPEAVTVFLTPPSFKELEKRLTGRGTDAKEQIDLRISRAKEELKLVGNYDYIIINSSPAEAAEELRSIIMAEKCKTAKRIDILEEF